MDGGSGDHGGRRAMRRMRPRGGGVREVLPGTALLGALGLVLAACSNDNGQNSLQPEGEPARQILNLFTPVFWIAVVVGVGVFAGVIVVLVRFRERTGDEKPRQVHGSTPLEIGWTIAPAVILAAIAVPTIATIFDIAERPEGPEVLEITVTGKQWWWQYEYAEQEQVSGPAVVTANELHIPVDTEVVLDLQACEEGPSQGACNVIHSFWVPELAGKTDVIPSRDNFLKVEAERTGTFLGQCAEYCGLSHANMRLRVIVHDRAGFDDWIREQQEPGLALTETVVEAGEERTVPVGGEEGAPALITQEFGCTNCHSFEDPSVAGFGPNLAHLASRETFGGATFELNAENLTDWILDAPGMKPMEAQYGCPAPEPGELKCVGMPSFSEDLPEGVAPMTRDQARQIAEFLLEETG